MKDTKSRQRNPWGIFYPSLCLSILITGMLAALGGLALFILNAFSIISFPVDLSCLLLGSGFVILFFWVVFYVLSPF